jgi:hypothetical protein
MTSERGSPTHSNPASTATSPRDAMGDSGSRSPIQRKEVDYYLNPTELFRWINYRRWDGAKSRVLSHPDECFTWIVSRHSSDGRILWRHLPLHLVCMQSENGSTDNSSQATRQIEELVNVLLEAYPDGANSPDDQGMLPLHLIVANSAQPNERILYLLLIAYPTGVDVKDKYGRTPVDIVNEKVESGPHREAALRAMARAKLTTERLVEAIREENTSLLASTKQSSSNERMASQRIIMRLEDEIENSRKQLEESENRNRDGEGTFDTLQKQVEHMKEDKESSKNLILMVKRERDDLMNQNEILRNQLEEHADVVNSLHQEFEGDRQDRSDTITQLKSEVSTSRAMAEALESQLRSRFTNEEYLTTTVSELETQLADLKTQFQQETTKLMQDRDAYSNENTQLKRIVEDLTKKSTLLQSKLTEVNKQMSGVLSSHGALNAEHDRMLDASLRVEADLIENTRTERTQMLAHVRKQWEFFESAVKDQEQMLEDFQQKEMDLLEIGKEERDRSVEVISNMRQDFRDARASASDRQRTLETENLVPSSAAASVGSPKSQVLKASPNDAASDGKSASSSQQTRRRSSSEHSRSRRKSPSSSTYTSRSSRQSLPPTHPPVEHRIPPSTEISSGDKRQGPAISEQMEGNLLHLLETRADQGSGRHRRQFSGTESTSYGASTFSSGLSSSFRNTETGYQKPRMINVPGSNRTVNFTEGSTTASSSTPGNASMSRTTASSVPKPGKAGAKLSLDEYSNHSSGTSASGSIDDSDSDSSSRGGSSFSRHKGKDTTGQYAGMTTGLRMGMIRISEDASQSDVDSRYSRQ